MNRQRVAVNKQGFKTGVERARVSDSAQSSGLTARVGHLDIASALSDSLVQLVGDSLNSPPNRTRLTSVCLFLVIYASVYILGSHDCAGMPAL